MIQDRLPEGDAEESELSPARKALLQRYLQGGMAKQGLEAGPVRRQVRGTAPLTDMQRRLWLIWQMDPNSAMFNEAVTVRIAGDVDVEALSRALNAIVRRHEIWRTSFPVVDGLPAQQVHEIDEFPLDTVDLRAVPDVQLDEQIRAIATDDARRPFDLLTAPPLRGVLMETTRGVTLALTFHHILFDGHSIQDVFVRELTSGYAAFSRGAEPAPADLPLQFGDYTTWQQEVVGTDSVQGQLEFWRNTLSGDLPVVQLPLDRPRPAARSGAGATRYLQLDKELVERVKQVSSDVGATPFSTLLAAFYALLHRYTGQTDLMVMTVHGARGRPELEGLLGYFLNVLPLRASVDGEPTFRRMVETTRAVTLAAFAHADIPFPRILSALGGERGRESVFDGAQFTMDPPELPLPEGWSIDRTVVDTGTAKSELSFYLHQNFDGTMYVRAEYSTDSFDEATILRMLSHYRVILAAALENLDQPIWQLPVLTDGEREQMLMRWNDTSFPFPEQATIQSLIAGQVERTPDRVAVHGEGGPLTFRELDERTNQLAHYLRSLGAGPEVCVGVYLDRSVHMLVALLGVLKSGSAYVPLDPAYPKDRLSLVLDDAQVAIILSSRSLHEDLPTLGATVVYLDEERDAIAAQPVDAPVTEAGPETLAYLIYTSGSTGKPKGVQIIHRGAVNMINYMAHGPGFTADDVMFAITSPSFDIALLELFLPLTVGGQVVVAPQNDVLDGGRLVEALRRSGATVMQATPATWRMMLAAGWPEGGDLTVWTGGEALSPELAEQLQKRSRAVWNLYGPTETSVWSTTHLVQPGEAPVPIGRPLDNTQVYLLDRHLQPVPVGVAGEIYIGGTGVARGYLRRPELNAERFIQDPFSTVPGARMYKTGDLGRYRVDGLIDYSGRTDFQVKVRGFRIELGEIESVLRREPSVNEAVVVARGDDPSDQRLIAYVVSEPGSKASVADLRQVLQETLPPYMVPSGIVVLDAFPLTPNGKIDRKKLPEPERGRLDDETPFVPPRTPTEQTLARIWSEVLGVERVGVFDNFFDLGGHSLIAVKLLDMIEREYGRHIPLATLFSGATIDNLQRALLENGSAKDSPLTVVRAGGSGIPIFWLHGQPLGRGFYSLKLARKLGDDQPFYVLQPHELIGENVPETVEEIAASYINEVRSVRPHGPYVIGGFCLSGVVAFEMGRQLREAGEDVPLLVLLHAEAPNFRRTAAIRAALDAGARLTGAEKGTSFEWYTRLRDARSAYVRGGVRGVTETLRGRVSPAAGQASGNSRHDRGMDPYFWAVSAYRLRRIPGKLTVFRDAGDYPDEPALGWDGTAEEVELVQVPGHDSVLREEVDDLSAQLSRVLAAANHERQAGTAA